MQDSFAFMVIVLKWGNKGASDPQNPEERKDAKIRKERKNGDGNVSTSLSASCSRLSWAQCALRFPTGAERSGVGRDVHDLSGLRSANVSVKRSRCS